jgi:hypothetical protein
MKQHRFRIHSYVTSVTYIILSPKPPYCKSGLLSTSLTHCLYNTDWTSVVKLVLGQCLPQNSSPALLSNVYVQIKKSSFFTCSFRSIALACPDGPPSPKRVVFSFYKHYRYARTCVYSGRTISFQCDLPECISACRRSDK